MPRPIRVALTLILPLAACGDHVRAVPDEPELAITLDNTPAPLGNDAHAVIAFHVDGAPATTTCALDGAAATACTSPFEADVADGSHQLTIVADAMTPVTASYHWQTDTAAPDTAIDLGPAPVDNTASPSVAFSTAAPDADHFECALDDAAFATCASPLTLAAGDGSHVFRVRAVDAAGNADPTPAELRWTADTAAPQVMISSGPDTATPDPTPSWTFTVTGDPANVQCRIDDAAFADCSGRFDAPALAAGPHRFDLAARDAAGNIATAHRAFVLDPSTCGNGALDLANGEVCDASELGGATCTSAGHPAGALKCAADCGGYDTSGCTGGYVAANINFAGTPCYDGIRYSTPLFTAPYALVCTDHNGIFKSRLDPPIAWTNTTSQGVVAPNTANLNGRAVAVNPNGPPVYYVSDATSLANGFRSSNGGDSWTAQALASAGSVFDVFAFVFRQNVGYIAGSWSAALGAVVLHGNQPTTMVPHFAGDAPGAVTGTVRGIASGGAKDVYVAVYGQTPAGAPASGGIFRACDLTATAGGAYAERDTGIAFDDRNRVWSLTVDPSSINTNPFQCGESTSSGSATTYYAALRGGGQIYKTTNSGLNWYRRNTGLPAGAEVYVIAIDCYSNGQVTYCPDPDLLYAGTSAGLYKTTDGGEHWTLDGFEGQVVRAVAIHPSATPLQMLVGVDDAVGVYRNTPVGQP